MELTKTEVFECTKCGTLSKNKEDVIKCLQKHRKEELKAEKEAAFFNIQTKLRMFFIENLTSFNILEVKNKLIDAAKIVGYNLTLTDNCSGPNFRSYYQGYAVYSLNGSFKKEGASEFDGIKIPFSSSHYLSSLLDKKRTAYFGDFISCIKGLDTGNSSGGVENFGYEIRLRLSDFPELNAKYNEFVTLTTAKQAYQSRSQSLLDEYRKNILPTILHSDIPYQEVKADHDELLEKIKDLQAKLSEISSKMSARQDILNNQHSEKYITPSSAYNYDAERLIELKAQLF